MASRGTPIPMSVRLEIKLRRTNHEPVRKVADSLRVSKTTVQKYGQLPPVRKNLTEARGAGRPRLSEKEA